mmetsp:Transcript_92443/g.277414  ORF Transcript_92443/g.277414 Transcript_92443/m.277414 type:complete len:223 (-) Transcript_92443:618-1286(-)
MSCVRCWRRSRRCSRPSSGCVTTSQRPPPPAPPSPSASPPRASPSQGARRQPSLRTPCSGRPTSRWPPSSRSCCRGHVTSASSVRSRAALTTPRRPSCSRARRPPRRGSSCGTASPSPPAPPTHSRSARPFSARLLSWRRRWRRRAAHWRQSSPAWRGVSRSTRRAASRWHRWRRRTPRRRERWERSRVHSRRRRRSSSPSDQGAGRRAPHSRRAPAAKLAP